MPKPLSAETKSLIESLYKPASFLDRSTRRKLTILGLVGGTGEPAAIPDLASLLLDRNQGIAQAAANAVIALSSHLHPGELPWLDQFMRQRSPYGWSYPSAWAELKPNQLDRLEGLGTEFVFALGMASFHFNGYVREQALRRLAAVKNGSEIPLLLLRVNDWVEEVRDTAQRLVRDRLTINYAPFFVNNLVLVTRLQLGRRGRPQAIFGAIEALLKDKDSQYALRAGLDSQDTETRRACYRLAFGSGLLDQEFVTERALSESDPAIRLWGVHNLSLVSNSVTAARLLLRAGTDRFAPVRRKALQVYSERFPELAAPWLKQALMDSLPSVRGYAQFQLGKQSDFDLRQFYLEALAKSDTMSLCSAISGLGEVGASSDTALIVRYVSHEVPKVRRAALRTLLRLHADDFVDVFVERLSDRAPAVSREAMKGLNKAIHLIAGERVWRIFVGTAAVHTRRNALFLISRLSKWESIGYLVEALCADNECLKKLAETYVRRWHWQFNRSFAAPANEQMERLKAAIERCGDRLDQPVRELLEFTSRP
ncbi:MAG TPA: hypothetical protein VKT33_14055 [Candidatus Angelobacter sp.]|nr:hypothetical protein [Candidatus Angelobacter sp.]